MNAAFVPFVSISRIRDTQLKMLANQGCNPFRDNAVAVDHNQVTAGEGGGAGGRQG